MYVRSMFREITEERINEAYENLGGENKEFRQELKKATDFELDKIIRLIPGLMQVRITNGVYNDYLEEKNSECAKQIEKILKN